MISRDRTTTPQDAASDATAAPSLLSQLGVAARALVVLTFITGVGYPLVVTGVASVAFTNASKGSLVTDDGKVVGSRHIGQPFDDPKYFWGRVSATAPSANNAQASAGSNLGPTNPQLTENAKARVDALRAADPGNTAPVPVDLVTSSGSGLDPHITPAGAAYQVARIARLRGMEGRRVRALVDAATEGRDFGVFGEPRVNVLALNVSLDRAAR